MEEPSRRTSRLSIAAATVAAFGLASAGFVLGRSTAKPAPAPVPAARPAPVAIPAPALPAVQPPLGRADLIAAGASAVDALAASRPLPDTVAKLAGREFELRLPFGCPGAPELAGSMLAAAYDPATETLRARAEPVRWASGEWLPRPPGEAEPAPAAESVEGFWIARPWTASEDCPPAPPAGPGAGAGAGEVDQTLGIAQFFNSEGSRVGRRDGKAFVTVESVAPDALNASLGLRLRLRGKLAQPAGAAGPVLCRPAGAARPACLIAVSLDEVAIENPATGATLSSWDVASPTRGPAGN